VRRTPVRRVVRRRVVTKRPVRRTAPKTVVRRYAPVKRVVRKRVVRRTPVRRVVNKNVNINRNVVRRRTPVRRVVKRIVRKPVVIRRVVNRGGKKVVVKKVVKKPVVVRRVVRVNRKSGFSRLDRNKFIRKCRYSIIRYRRTLTKDNVSPKTREIVRNKIYRIRVIRGGLRYVNYVNGVYRHIQALQKKSPTPARKEREARWRERAALVNRIYRDKNIGYWIRLAKKPSRRFSRKCNSFKKVFSKQYRALDAAKKKLIESKAAERLTVKIEIAKIKTEIYGQQKINRLKRSLARLNAYKKKMTYPALERRIAQATSILAAARAHFATALVKKTQAGLFKTARKGCKRVVKVRYFRGKRVPKDWTIVRRVKP